MMFIPAIDLIEGSCVRLTRGDYSKKIEYGEDPVELASRFRDQGAARLHVVDLDAARSGSEGNLKVIERIIRAASIPVQVGGGVRERGRVARLAEAGASGIILGTVLVKDQELARSLAAEFGTRMIAGIDASEGWVRTTGWTEPASLTAVDLARQAEGMGFGTVIYTDISRDGTLQGPNLDAIAEVAGAVGIPLIAAGGISRLADLHAVAGLEELGVTGVIAGKAIYEGRFTVAEACAALRSAGRKPGS